MIIFAKIYREFWVRSEKFRWYQSMLPLVIMSTTGTIG